MEPDDFFELYQRCIDLADRVPDIHRAKLTEIAERLQNAPKISRQRACTKRADDFRVAVVAGFDLRSGLLLEFPMRLAVWGSSNGDLSTYTGRGVLAGGHHAHDGGVRVGVVVAAFERSHRPDHRDDRQ